MIELTPEQAERLRAHMEKSNMMAEARKTDAVKERLADIRERLINGEGTTQIINALRCSGRLVYEVRRQLIKEGVI